MRPELRTYLLWALLRFALVLLQVTVVPLISIARVLPSLPLIGLTFIALRHGGLQAMFYAFPSGLMIDLYSGAVVGLTSLSFVAAVFVIGFFHDPERSQLIIRNIGAVILTTAAAFISSLIFAFAYLVRLDSSIWNIILLHVLGSTLYTAALSIIPVLILARTGPGLKV